MVWKDKRSCFAFAIASAVAMVVGGVGVTAAGAVATASTVTVTSVAPGVVHIPFGVANITVHGTGFQSGATLALGHGGITNDGLFSISGTNVVNDTTITATVTSGSTVSVETLTVTNPDSSFGSLPNAFIGRTTAGEFHPMTPLRVLDTRNGTGRPHPGPIHGGRDLVVALVGPTNPLPLTNVAAVVLNLTATDVTAPGFVTVWPHRKPQPATTNLSVETGVTRAVLTTVGIGAGGKIDITYSGTGKLDLVADVVGWYAALDAPTSGSVYSPAVPVRLLDTRPNPIPSGGTVVVHVVPPGSKVSAAALNLTVPTPTSPGYVTAWAGGTRPPTSNLNVTPGVTVSNAAIVPVAPDGTITIFMQLQDNLVVDLMGTFDDGTTATLGGQYTSLKVAARIVDTRSGTGGHTGPLAAGSTTTFAGSGVGGVPASNVEALTATATSLGSASVGYFTVFPAGTPQPVVSTLNYAPPHIVANLALIPLNGFGQFSIYSPASSDATIDVAGWYSSAEL
jgi:hypothetical protein